MEFLESMPTRYGIRPDASTLLAALNVCAANGDWRRAETLLADCLPSGGGGSSSGGRRPWTAEVVVGEEHFGALITACARGGAWVRALELLGEEQLRNQPQQPLSASPEASASPELSVATMRASGLRPSLVCYNAVLDALAKASQADLALALLARMTAKGAGEEEAEEVREEGGEQQQQSDELRRPRPDVVSFSTAIAACAAAGDWRGAVRTLEGMQGVPPNACTMAAVLRALAEGAAVPG